MAADNEPPRRTVHDEHSGRTFELSPETTLDLAAAWFSVLYMLGAITFFLWLLFDIWMGRHSLASFFNYKAAALASSATFRLMAYTGIGGALGALVNGIRSFLRWHSDEAAFGRRFAWKYVTAPWLGVTLALLVHAIMRGGLALLGGGLVGSSPAAEGTASASLAALAMGALAGYGSRDVLVWLDARVASLFSTKTATTVKVPELVGKTRDEAEGILKEAGLRQKTEEEPGEEAQLNKVIRQDPSPGAEVTADATVTVVVAVKKAASS